MSTHLPGFQSFFRFLHPIVLAKLATGSIKVKKTSFVMIKIATRIAVSSNITINDCANFNSIDCISEREREENYHII